ncbi:uncharacterized protein Z519_12321 [Cladophialophora bantiana CBS 173.52]|uniref:Shugoshin C-terminal domain-containing protein n=1 Tax=Cladophialophora bantiana (strain ATCC 10958 / CBS 173.52 / CDC B-1940 / NIH 8579) TaxID=1442370 RepID=A0A0D2HRN1_CLAB1|nr:uncharacterized protein Z519_12321 [Cladophialophora bantiana CBS 173.52]KIW87024.1 hypothetical protein Z519_12321 [Cladophialophora bantiana CBS 173.52]
MAKLNDPPNPPMESFESLKRRFIRQNREIARANSSQSQRIRNLETEISRLVAENIFLREQAIAAQAEAERWRAASSVNAEILDMRDRLNRKMEEVSELLVEMGNLPEKVAREGRRKSRLVRSTMSATTEQEWRNRQSIREALAQERGDLYDGRLPAIQEDKLYPRRTLETAEVTALREEAAMQQASDSPELGPPPVAHFDVVSDPLGLDSARTSEDENGGEEVMQLPSLLERRRKRRTSTLIHDLPTEEASGPNAPTIRPNPQLLKSGAKRKLDVSELDDPAPQQPLNENDDFVFQRRQEIWNNATVNSKKTSRFTRPPGREPGDATDFVKQSSPQKPASSTRKILAPKSTNSPAKRRLQVAEKLKDDRDPQQKHQTIRPTRQKDPPAHVVIECPVEASNDYEKEIPPKTPAAEADDILSPISTEPSSRTSHQTKEAAVLNSVEDVLSGSIGRGSRRPRPQISYAEPNLRDKMRRPGKGLVGAVEGIEKQKENASSARGTSMERAKPDDVKVKQENETNGEDQGWKDLAMPTSTSRKKEEPMSPLRGKERKEKGDDETRKTAKQPKANAADELEKAVDRLSIFDPPASSPIEDSTETWPDTEGQKLSRSSAAARRKASSSALATGRRHSMQPASSSSGDPTGLSSAPRHPSLDPSKLDAQPLPRPSSAASLRGDAPSTSMASAAKDLKRSHSVSSNSKDKELGASGAETGLNVSSRVERALNRRRSMMV